MLTVGWHTLMGGYLFGLGMVLAGGCATGNLLGNGKVTFGFSSVRGSFHVAQRDQCENGADYPFSDSRMVSPRVFPPGA